MELLQGSMSSLASSLNESAPITSLAGGQANSLLQNNVLGNHQSDSSFTNGIGNLEHHIHSIFAKTRVPGEDFVYMPTYDLFNALDNYCDDTTIHETKDPLLIVGEAGSGKSALLSNWIDRRKKQVHRKGGSSLLNEFIFWHAVGSSRSSMDVNSLMRRMIDELKTRFQLNREMPETQDKLSWELPRFFEMAARRGIIIIVIDGLNRLMTGDDSGLGNRIEEASLRWLPLEFPPNVRVILSVTSHPNVDLFDRSFITGGVPKVIDAVSDSRPHRILGELQRRRWELVNLKPLELSICRGVIESYVKKCVQVDINAAAATLGEIGTSFLTEIDHDDATSHPSSHSIHGFLLFDTQISALLDHTLGGTPMFLRLFLRCAHFAVTKGFCIWHIWHDWLKADSISTLVEHILSSFETGFHPTEDSKKFAIESTLIAGGLPALRVSYRWHPSFHVKDDKETADLMQHIKTIAHEDGSLVETSADNNNHNRSATGSTELKSSDNHPGLSQVVQQNLGDQHWIAASQDAIMKMNESRVSINQKLEENLKECRTDAQTDDDAIELLVQNILKLKTKLSCKLVESPSKLAKLTSIADLDNIESDDEDSHAHDANSRLSPSVTSGRVSPGTRSSARHSISEHRSNRTNIRSGDSNSPHTRIHKSINDSNENPSENFETLPLYFRGGSNVQGFKSLLGNSLALLYVARHGLKESELWALLSELKVTTHESNANGPSESGVDISKELMKLCYQARGLLEDCWKIQDLAHSNKLSIVQLQNGMVKAHNAFKKADVLRLLEITGLANSSNINSYQLALAESDTDITGNFDRNYGERVVIDYQELLKRVVKYETMDRSKNKNKKKLVKSIKGSNSKSNIADQNIYNEWYDSADNDGNKNSLGTDLEEALLGFLVAVGLLHSPQNHLILFPSDNMHFREVVRNKYVLAFGGVEFWHGQMITFFENQPNSMRRCEELPWHLQICHRWNALKDALIDIRTFYMMYALRGDGDDALKEEYMSYWITLTEGPLYVSDAAQKAADLLHNKLQQQYHNSGNNGENHEKNYKILAELDTALALGLSEKEAKRQLYKNQVSPFDVIEEMNKTVELWVSHEKPSPLQLRQTILLIGRFLSSFCSCKPNPPPFLREGVDIQALQSFGIVLDELRDVDPHLHSNLLKQKEKLIKSTRDLILFPTEYHINARYYYYIRWFWIQFPWIALDYAFSTATNAQKGLDTPNVGTVIPEVAVDLVAPQTKKTTKGTGMQRYWEVKKQDPTVVVIHHTDNRKNAAIKSHMLPAKSYEALDGTLTHIKSEIVSAKPTIKFRRSFEEELNAYKNIPHSEHCKRSLRLGSLFPSREEAIKKHNEQVLDNVEVFEQATASIRRGGEGVHLEPTLEEELKRLKYEEDLKNWNNLRGGALPLGSDTELEFDRELQKMGKLRALYDSVNCLHRQRQAFCDELKLKYESRSEQDEEIQSDVLSAEIAIASLEQRYMTMCAATDHTKTLNTGYDMLIELMERCPPSKPEKLAILEQNVELARQQLKDLQLFRQSLYKDAERLEQVKRKQLSVKIQYYKTARNDLKVKRKKIIRSSPSSRVSTAGLLGRTAPIEIKNVTNDVSSNVSLASASDVASETKMGAEVPQTTAEVSPTTAEVPPTTDLAEGSGEIKGIHFVQDMLNHSFDTVDRNRKYDAMEVKKSKGVYTSDIKKGIYHYDKSSLQNEVLTAFETSAHKAQAIIDNAPRMQAKMMFDFVAERTGFTTEEEFITRFNEGQKLTDILRSDQLAVDGRLAQLNTEYANIYATWSDSVFASKPSDHYNDEQKSESKSGNDDDARNIDSKLFHAEMKLNQTQRQLEKILHVINEVRTGVSHLLKLIEVNSKLLHNLPKTKLPVINDQNDIVNALSWVEERVQSIHEATSSEGNKITHDEKISLSERQINFAVTVQEMLSDAISEKNSRSRDKKGKGRLSKQAIDSNDSTSVYTNRINQVVVPKSAAIDVLYEEKHTKVLENRDKQEDQYERQQLLKSKDSELTVDAKNFVKEALSTRSAEAALRKANAIAGTRSGRNATYGAVMEDLLKSKGPSLPSLGSSIGRK